MIPTFAKKARFFKKAAPNPASTALEVEMAVLVCLAVLLTPAIMLASPAQIGEEVLIPDPHFRLRAFRRALSQCCGGHRDLHLNLGFLQAPLKSFPKKYFKEGLLIKVRRVFISDALSLKKLVWILCLWTHSTLERYVEGSTKQTPLPSRILTNLLSLFLNPPLKLETAANGALWPIFV